MKETKKITVWVKNKLWGRYLLAIRKKLYNNSFEMFCKQEFKSE